MGGLFSKPNERIRIAAKRVKEIELDVYTRKTIIHLYLCKDNIVTIDRNIKQLRNLRVLQICCNNLTKLPKEIGELQQLSILFLSRNNLTEIPTEVSLLKKLNDLNISDNKITTIPESLENLKELKIIDISGNPIKTLPAVISRIKSLTSISILRTEISYLPPTLLELSFLTELNFTTQHRASMILKNGSVSLLELVCEHTIKHTRQIKELLPIGILKHINSVKKCDICSMNIYSPITVYTSVTIAGNEVPVKYTLCKNHKIDHRDVNKSIHKAMFIEECTNSTSVVKYAPGTIDILKVSQLIRAYSSAAE